MARHFRPLIGLMTILLALAGTASAAGSLTGSLSGSLHTDDAALDAGGDVDVAAPDGGLPSADATGDLAASAHGHEVAAGVDTDGELYAAADDHTASANVNVDEPSASLTVDGTTVSTDDVDTSVEVPGVPDAPHGSIGAEIVASLSGAAAGFAASIGAAISALFSW